jgi:hypothetical protein
MTITTLWDIVLISTMLIAVAGGVGQLLYVGWCRRSKAALYWVGIKTSNGLVLLFVAVLCALSLLDVSVHSIFVRLSVLMLVFNLSAGGVISIVRVLRNRSRMGDPCD